MTRSSEAVLPPGDKHVGTTHRAISEFLEDSIVHHRKNGDSVIPVWVATDLLDWGGLTYPFAFAPLDVRAALADSFGLTAPQLRSWMRALNIVRNVCAHHSRLFNRYYSVRPRMPREEDYPSLVAVAAVEDTTFGMLTLVQHLASHAMDSPHRLLPAALSSFPEGAGMNIQATGAIPPWDELELRRR